MTRVYFIRHCEPNYKNKNDRERELTEIGLEDRKNITDYLLDKDIDVIFSSPYKRCLDSIKPFAETVKLSINQVENLKERNIGQWVEDFNAYSFMQWKDFNYKMEDGESLSEVQSRTIVELKNILENNRGKNILISTHGTAFSTIMNYYDKEYNYDTFRKIKNIMPFLALVFFEEEMMLSYELFDLSKNEIILKY